MFLAQFFPYPDYEFRFRSCLLVNYLRCFTVRVIQHLASIHGVFCICVLKLLNIASIIELQRCVFILKKSS